MSKAEKIALLKDTLDKLGITYDDTNENIGYIEILSPYGDEINFEFTSEDEVTVFSIAP